MKTQSGFKPSTILLFLCMFALLLPLFLVAIIADILTPKEMLHPKDPSDPKFIEYWEKRNNSWFSRAFHAVSDRAFRLLS